MRLRLLNVKYSPNLGDGLLSECLERALGEAGAPDTRSVDLAARTEYRPGTARRSALLSMLAALPAPVRRSLVDVPLRWTAARRLGPHYAAGLADADAVVVGGGNLLTDVDLNFPTKLGAALARAAELDRPVAIFGCGVGADWSATGRRRLLASLRRVRLVHVAVRDVRSREIWDREFAAATGRSAVVVHDPGILAARYFAPSRPAGTEEAKVVGIGVMSAVAVRYHAAFALADDALADWYADLAAACLGHGLTPVLFTNGSPEDRLALKAVLGRIASSSGAGGRVLVRQPETPGELGALAGGVDALVAFRMHAVIAAVSHDRPAIALAWDDKLRSFMASIGRESDLHDVRRSAPRDVAAALAAATASARSPGSGTLIAEAMRDVAELHGRLFDARTTGAGG